MSDVEFDIDQQQTFRTAPMPSGLSPAAKEGSSLSRLFIRLRLAHSEQGAQRAMLAVAIIALAVTAFLIYKLLTPPHADIPKVMPPFIQYG